MASSPPTAPAASPIVVRQSGGAGALVTECQNRDYLTRIADYIVEGTVTSVESRWNEEKTAIFTYTNFAIVTYVKGAPLPVNTFQIVTPGGTVGDVTQAVEDQPILHEGGRARLYLRKANGEFSIVCGRFGVEGLELRPVPAPTG
ncbi:MAG: hypothetical protein AB1603_02955 [Chloroflexota bacterium]